MFSDQCTDCATCTCWSCFKGMLGCVVMHLLLVQFFRYRETGENESSQMQGADDSRRNNMVHRFMQTHITLTKDNASRDELCL